jgi:predicted amidohydrolase YtcJ
MTDLVLSGGRVLGVEGPDGVVVVRDGAILAVGGPETRERAGPGAATVDLQGGLLVPGFTDAHVHPVQGGIERRTCDLTGAKGEPAYLECIRAYAGARPELDWIVGAGWEMAAFPGGTPTAASLDAAVGGRPAYLVNRDHHGAWVSSRALALAGVDERTPDPESGRIERDVDGLPTGTLHEGAMALVERLVPKTGPAEMMAGLLEGQRYLHALGITGWQDAIVGAYDAVPDNGHTYRQAVLDGTLTARVVGALWWPRGVDDVAAQVADLVARREELTGGRFRATSVKIMADGVAENFTAAMGAPYLDARGHATDNAGLSFVPREVLLEAVPRLDAEGFQVHVHAIGDRAVRDALDAFEAARGSRQARPTDTGPTDNRHHIAHLQVVHPDDVRRFADLGVAANMQPLWAAHEPQMDELTIPFLGPERSTWQYPFAALRDTGARLVAGSDWPVTSPNPLWGMHVAVNRIAPPEELVGDPSAFLPEQRLRLSDALGAYTEGSAWVNHRDDAGRIEPGRLADLALLDRDVTACPVEEISAARVLGTWVGGERVHA